MDEEDSSPEPELRRRGRRVLLPTIVTVAVLIFGIAIFTGVWTDRLWFQSIGYSSVFNTLLRTKALLFVVFGLFFAAVIGVNVFVAYRTRPILPPRGQGLETIERYREVIEPQRKRILVALAVLFFVIGGSIASGQWSNYLMWRNGVSFHQNDVYFGKDIGFFVFDYPWLRFVLSFTFAVLAVAIVAVALVDYVFGGIILTGRPRRMSAAAQVQLSVLIGLFIALKAVAYWLDRYGLAISQGRLFTGISYTDAHARIPAKNILMVIAIICALLFFANVFRRSWLLPGLGLGLLALSALLVGIIWPTIMQSFEVRPSEPDKEGPFIARNIAATRDAYGLNSVRVDGYAASSNLPPSQLAKAAEALPGTRLLDPTLVSPAFEQLQQVRGYYSVPSTLDVDRYTLKGSAVPQDIVIAARELNLNALPSSQRNWANDHTVYTHGYGVVAARGNARDALGNPVWVEQDIPLRGQLGVTQPRIYFGESTPSYSIVGRPPGAAPIEIDTPRGGSSTSSSTDNFTYDGGGGVPIGGWFNKTLYALKFGEPNLLLSSRVNSYSKILYNREPRQRVKAVAPWLTIDGNPYPAVVDGHIEWIVDAYTTSNSYPMSQTVNLDQATSDTLTDTGSNTALPSSDINYIRNSVKATVDAYTGAVTLYAWDQSDPILQTWEKAFPGVVKPKSDISPALMAHLRYPEDLFKVQRDILSQYHVTNPQTWYEGGERWELPEDPAAPSGSGSIQPPYYLSVQMPAEKSAIGGPSDPGTSTPEFSLTSVYLPRARQNLSAFVSVDSEATSPDYGTIRILQLPTDTQIQGPSQVANQMQSDPGVSRALFRYKQPGTQIQYGNLLTLPVGNGLLYVQPVYVQRTAASGSYPKLQQVLATFGGRVGHGQTLDDALRMALGVPPSGGAHKPPHQKPGGGQHTGADQTASSLLGRAELKYEQALTALKNGQLDVYAQRVSEMQTLIARAKALLDKAGVKAPPKGGTAKGGTAKTGTAKTGTAKTGSG